MPVKDGRQGGRKSSGILVGRTARHHPLLHLGKAAGRCYIASRTHPVLTILTESVAPMENLPVNAWLEPLSGAPCGEDLEYDPQFMELSHPMDGC